MTFELVQRCGFFTASPGQVRVVDAENGPVVVTVCTCHRTDAEVLEVVRLTWEKRQ